MTEVEFVQNLLSTQWESSISNRSTDVPEPTFVREKSKRKERLRTRDVGYVASLEDTTHTPMGFGWTHHRVDTAVVVEYRAATRTVATGYDDGYHRLFGKRTGDDGLQAPDRWDGITGETARIVLADRTGRAEWDLVGDELRIVDNADLGGTNYYRADVAIPLANIADSIDTSV